MDNKFLMGRNDILERTSDDNNTSTFVSQDLRLRLMKAAISKSLRFYDSFLGKPNTLRSLSDLAKDYIEWLRDGRKLNLFEKGGVREKDHLNLWCLSQVAEPTTYIESGTFIGSSLHAFLQNPSLKRVIAIDPYMGNLRIAESKIPNASLIEDKDFSQIDLHEEI